MSQMGRWCSRNYQHKMEHLWRLTEQYQSLPFDSRSDSGLDEEMRSLSEQMVARPPLVEKTPGGVWAPAGKGLHRFTLAERKRLNFYEPIRDTRTLDGELNPETDLKPKFIVPDIVKGPQGETMTGEAWFEKKFGDSCPKPEYTVMGFRRVPLGEWAQWINQGFMEHLIRFVEWVHNQGSVGSCGAEGTAGAADCKEESRGFRSQGGAQDTQSQPYFLYKITSGGYDGGSSPRDNIALIQRLGCCRQAVRPRSRGWRAAHTQEELDDAAEHKTLEVVAFPTSDIELLGTMILYGVPVAAGYSGHWWWMVGVLSRTQGIMQNSWGASWGENGRAPISFSSLRYMLCGFLDVMDASHLVY